MNHKTIIAIFKKDLLDGMRNYHMILMFLTPIILSLLFSNVLSGSKSTSALPEIGVISSPQQPMIESLTKKGLSGKIVFYQNKHDLESAILEGKIRFGIILPEIISNKSPKKHPQGITMLYPPHIPDFGVETLRATFEKEIREQLGLNPPPLPFKFELLPVAGSSSISSAAADSIFPILIVMAMGMVGFLALPMSIVEEREKGTLNAIFLTPLKTSEFILGKTLFSFCLALATICIMLTVNGKWGNNIASLALIAGMGVLMTIFIGLVVARVAQTQASVNAIGTMLFLFFQIVPSLQHTSETVRKIAPLFPSTYIFSGLRKTMFLDLEKVSLANDLSMIFCMTSAAYLISWLVYKLKKADK